MAVIGGWMGRKFFPLVRVVVPGAWDVAWQSCTTTAYIRIACTGIRAVPSDFRFAMVGILIPVGVKNCELVF